MATHCFEPLYLEGALEDKFSNIFVYLVNHKYTYGETKFAQILPC
jgi:hypothetical protein